MVIDTFSKFGWIFPLRDKTGKSVAGAFEQLFKLGRVLQYLQTDNFRQRFF